MRKSRSVGFSLPELMLVCAIFAGFLLLTHYLLSHGLGVWQRTASSQDSGLQLARAERALREDLRASGVTSIGIAHSGKVLWMLSAVDPTTGEVRYQEDGTPLWQRNILYYLVKPPDHDRLYRQVCLDQPYRCPHQQLVRAVIDGPNAAPPSEGAELLLSQGDIAPPENFLDETPPPIKGLESFDVVASGLVSFEVSRGENELAQEIEFRLRAFSAEGAGKVSAPGREDLRDSPFTHEILGSVFPGN